MCPDTAAPSSLCAMSSLGVASVCGADLGAGSLAWRVLLASEKGCSVDVTESWLQRG